MQPADTSAKTLRSDTLALLYQNILTGIVRIQAGRQPLTDVETFRKRMKAALQEVEREANVAGYSSGEVRDGEFAVVLRDRLPLIEANPVHRFKRSKRRLDSFGDCDVWKRME